MSTWFCSQNRYDKSNVAMYHIKIRICRTEMTQKNIQCSVTGLRNMMALRAQGRCGFDSIAGSGALKGRRCRGLGEDDGVVGLGTAWVDSVTGSGMAGGAQHRGLGNGITGMGLALAWSMASSAHVGEDGAA
jgi:hypothetical protein